MLTSCLEVLTGEHSYTFDQRLVLICQRAHNFGVVMQTWEVRKEGGASLPSHISRINTGDQWGHQYSSQITLTFMCSILI